MFRAHYSELPQDYFPERALRHRQEDFLMAPVWITAAVLAVITAGDTVLAVAGLCVNHLVLAQEGERAAVFRIEKEG